MHEINKNQLKKTKNNLSQSKLTCQTYDSGHETRITQQKKKIKLSYEIQFLINPMLKDDNEKKQKKTEST